MRKIGLLGTSALGSFTFIGLSLALAAPAHAQDEPAPDACASLPEGTERDNCLAGETELESGTNVNPTDATDAGITITGSRIRRPNLESTVPITSLAGEEFFQQGQNNIGDTLNELPQLRTTFGQQNAGRFLGTTGLNLLDLRGLGTQRTLVLVNGRRHVPSDILNNGVSPDVNTIPNDLIDRVDIVTGGNSAIYGSDAIAGVVNFVLKRNFEGLQVRGNAGISGYGSGGNQYAAAMYGMNFGDDRGNVTVHAEYAHQDRLHASDVPFLRQVDGFLAVDSDPAGTPNGSDGNPDRVFFRDIRRANINEATQIAFQNRTAAQGQIGGPLCGVGFNGTPFNCVYFFSPDGTQLIQQTGSSRIGTGPIGSFIGGNGTTGRENNLLTIFPDQTRYNANLLAHFTISEALEPFLEAKFVRVDTAGQNAGPAFVQGSTLGDPAQRERIRLDNPFLTAAQRAQITNILLTTGTAPGLSTAPAALTPGQIAAINAGTFRVPIQRN
ncbi:MAG TPA: TonB-dependent receptor plug domain-containing protein, partial [Allosphingosinicella sp.]|nr:TonB-dependent receptor plug domain-containing protein [Allosphingosinicella sp.]